jgi:hypothetical protein
MESFRKIGHGTAGSLYLPIQLSDLIKEFAARSLRGRGQLNECDYYLLQGCYMIVPRLFTLKGAILRIRNIPQPC